MPDTFDRKTRSKIMSSIRSKNTRVELFLRRAIHKKGLRFRIHYNIAGHPDFVFPSKRIAVFVDGDFWHGYNWNKLRPKLKNSFWRDKILRNIKRDIKVNSTLSHDGWRVIRCWEHEVKKDQNKCVQKILKAHKLRKISPY